MFLISGRSLYHSFPTEVCYTQRLADNWYEYCVLIRWIPRPGYSDAFLFWVRYSDLSQSSVTLSARLLIRVAVFYLNTLIISAVAISLQAFQSGVKKTSPRVTFSWKLVISVQRQRLSVSVSVCVSRILFWLCRLFFFLAPLTLSRFRTKWVS